MGLPFLHAPVDCFVAPVAVHAVEPIGRIPSPLFLDCAVPATQ